MTAPPAPRPTHRLEWHPGDAADGPVLARAQDIGALLALLDDHAHRLLAGGHDGVLLIVEDATDATVARRPVWLPDRPWPDAWRDPWWGTHEDPSAFA